MSIARRGIPAALISFAVAVALVVLLFPEVIFGGATFSSVSLARVIGVPAKPATVEVYPNIEARPPTSGLVDLGARTWQFEPTMRYVARALRDGSSLDWNPYQASGSLGPETLDGMQLSPFVLAVAALGGSGAAFTFVLLALIVGAFYCLQQLFVRSLEMHRVAAVGACFVFLLNGWATATFTDVTCVPYLMFPVVLYAVVEFQRRPGPLRFGVAVAAYAALFATTFSPGQALDVALITVVALVIDAWRRRDAERDKPWLARVAGLVGRQALVPAVGLAAVAVILVPALDAFVHAGADVTAYSRQSLLTRSAGRWLVLPSYLLADARPPGFFDGWQLYLGITPIVVVAAGLARVRGLARWLLVVTVGVALLALAQHMGMPGLKLIGDLPGLRIITNDYWAGLVAAASTIAFGVGIDVVRRSGLSLGVVLAAAVALDLVVLGVAWAAHWSWPAVLAAIVIALILEALIALAWLGDREVLGRRLLAAAAVALVALELGSYANHTRARRTDPVAEPAGFIRYLQTHVGDGRVLDAGSGTMLGNWGSALGVREVGTLDIMQIPWYRTFYLDHVGGLPDDKFLRIQTGPAVPFTADPTALDLLSVRYIVVGPINRTYREEVAARYPLAYRDPANGVTVFANPHAWSRAFLSPAVGPAPAPASTSTTSPPPLRFSSATTLTADPVLLAQARRAGLPRTGSAPATSSSSPAATSGGRARIVTDASTRVSVDVDAPRPMLLVLADTYHPNWSVTVNGVTQHVGQVDDVARGVMVPAGRSVVVFQYHSTARRIGWVISLVTVVGLIVVCGLWGLQRRRARSAGSAVAGPQEATLVADV